MFNLYGRSCLSLLDFSKDEILSLLNLARDLKQAKHSQKEQKLLSDLKLLILFQSESTRTRSCFEIAALDQGASPIFMDSKTTYFGHKETVSDSASVFKHYYDAIAFRGPLHQTCEQLSQHSEIPVYNALTDFEHPPLALAVLLTVMELPTFRSFANLKLTYFGDARNNIANSLMIACVKMGMNFAVAGPKKLWPSEKLVQSCREIAEKSGSELIFTENVDEAVQNANIVYTDVWVSMGESASVWADRIKLLLPYQVNLRVMKKAASDAIFLHCLPALHSSETELGQKIKRDFNLEEMEVTNEVFSKSKVHIFEQVENLLHVTKALMVATLVKD